jgi:hypothetical protein
MWITPHHPLLHATGKLDGIHIQHVMRKIHHIQTMLDLSQIVMIIYSLRFSSSLVIRPIFRMGFMAFMAYCGMIEISLNLNLSIASLFQIGSSMPFSQPCPPYIS